MNTTTTKLRENNNLFHPVLYKNAFSREECAAIIKLPGIYLPVPFYSSQEIKDSHSEVTKPELKVFSKCKTIYPSPNPPNISLYKKINAIGHDANRKFFKFILSNIQETRINELEENEYIDWHVDTGSGEASTRKITVLVFLSEPSEYEGGIVRFMPGIPSIEQEQGSAVVFASYHLHKVEPVTKGRRLTMPSFIHGDSFI